jgi:hypothetical protein
MSVCTTWAIVRTRDGHWQPSTSKSRQNSKLYTCAILAQGSRSEQIVAQCARLTMTKDAMQCSSRRNKGACSELIGRG